MQKPQYQAGTYVVVGGKPYYHLKPNEDFCGIVTGTIEVQIGNLNRETRKMDTKPILQYRVMSDNGSIERLVHEADITPIEPSALPSATRLALENRYIRKGNQVFNILL